MPYRLRIVHGERTQRIPLVEGEWTVGSSPEADIQITHPTVSRRHARLTVEEERVLIEDLGSSNGTRVNGKAVQGAVEMIGERSVRLGAVVIELETLRKRDSEVGIALTGVRSEVETSHPVAAATETVTQAPSVLEFFTNEFLPEVLRGMADADLRSDRAQVIGDGVFRTLPCTRVEILKRTGDEEALVFAAERKRRKEDTDDSDPSWISFGDEWVVRVLFPVENLARAYEPLVLDAALLAGCGSIHQLPERSERPERPDAPALPAPATVCPRMQHLYSSAARVAAGPISVLIHGESGTGKEILARYIHAASRRADRPLLTLNCAALPGDLLEAELFGVEKGVATGVDSRAGRFEQAHGGTLFLDEIGDMALETQAKILRVLQEKVVYRLGAGSPRPADVRIMSATNRDIDGLLEAGTFRSDLYHRIADWVVELPPLRRRREDIPNLAVYFLSHACSEAGIEPAGISRAALEVLLNAPWPGNIRQLEREMSRVALFLEDGDLLDTTRLQGSLFSSSEVTEARSLKDVLEDAEREAIEGALAAAGGDVIVAAKRLDVGRSTLYRRMGALGIGDSE